MIFETERLAVRNLQNEDFEAFHEMQSDIEVMRYTSGEASDEETNRRQLENCINRYDQPDNDFWVWAIVRKEDDQFIGTCAIVPCEGRSEIGYRFLRKFFGNGYGQEICDGLIDHAIESQAFEGLVAYVDVRNVASVKILNRSRLEFVEQQPGEDGATDNFYRWSRRPSADRNVAD